VGANALDANTTANGNSALGYGSLGANTTGAANVAVGTAALQSNTTANYNTALGYLALSANTTGTENVAIGPSALRGVTTGYENIGIGRNTGEGITTGNRNTFIGDDAGYLITGGSGNTIIGRYTGNNGGLDIRNSSNQIVLSDGDGVPSMRLSNGYALRTAATSQMLSIAQTWESSVNYDDLKWPGMFRVDNNATNAPTTSYHSVMVFGNGDNVTAQIAVQLATTNTYLRSFNQSWSSWVRLDT
jgi:hypothetical protein